MREHQVSPAAGSRTKAKRVGRGLGSGRGTYSGKGQKGQKARSGFTIRPGFEGGQLPIVKRLPEQRGFRNPFRTEYAVVNLAALDRFPTDLEITPIELVRAGLVHDLKRPVKILAKGEVTRSLHVRAHGFSAAARDKIIAAGGTAQEIDAATAATAGA